MQSVRRISCEGRSPSSIHREAREAALHGKSVSLNFVVTQDTLRSLEGVLSEQKNFGSSIVALNLSDSKLNVDNLSALSTMFAKSPLQTLVMERCGIDDRAAPTLAVFISQCPKLCTVNVRNNALSDAGAKLLHKSAIGHPCLQSVACDGCPVSIRRQKQLSDIPKKPIAGASLSSIFTPPAPTPFSTPHHARGMTNQGTDERARAVDELRAVTSSGYGKSKHGTAHTPLSSIAESTRLEWNILTLKQPPSSTKAGRSSSVPRFQTPSSSAVDRKPSYKNARTITQEVIDSMFSPTPRNVDNRVLARNLKFKTARADAFRVGGGDAFDRGQGLADSSSDQNRRGDFGDLLKDQQLAMLQSQCHSLETELSEQQQILKVQQERCAAAESQCLQLQHSRQQQAELISVMRKDLHRALDTVQAVSARCTQLICDRNLFREQKRSLEQLIGSFVSGVTSVGSSAPQHLQHTIETFAAGAHQSSAEETDEMEDGNKELMELLRSIWGNNDCSSLAIGDHPTPAIAKVARDFYIPSSTPGRDLQKDLLPQFITNVKSSSLGDDASVAQADQIVSHSDADFDEINRFLHSRVTSIIQHHGHDATQQTSPSGQSSGNSSAAQKTNQFSIYAAATDGDEFQEVNATDVETHSKIGLALSPNQISTTKLQNVLAAPAASSSALASAASSLMPAKNSAKQEPSLPTYEELQIQLQKSAGTDFASVSSATKTSSNETVAASSSALASAASILMPAKNSAKQEPSLPTYEELQIQLHKSAGTDFASVSSATKTSSNDTVAGSQIESRKDQVSVSKDTRAVNSMADELLDPIHEHETTLDSMVVRPLSEGKMQSSPHSSTDSLNSMLPIMAAPHQSELLAVSLSQADAHARSVMTSLAVSPTISSPKTYEEFQVALQRGYSGFASAVTGITGELMQPSPNSELRTASTYNDNTNGSSFPQTGGTRGADKSRRTQSNAKASGKSRSKQLIPNTENSSRSGVSSAASKTFPEATLFNLPSSFFS